MRALDVHNIPKRLLTIDDIARQLAIKKESAKVTAVRYVRKGTLIRLKKNLYISTDAFKHLSEKDIYGVANILQVPSYISLTSALSFYNCTTQQLRNVVESIALKRTKNIIIRNLKFTYSLVKKNLYNGFDRIDTHFIATPEKAFVDALYLTAMQKYNADFDAINFKKLNKKIVMKYIEQTNDRTKSLWNKLCKIYKI